LSAALGKRGKSQEKESFYLAFYHVVVFLDVPRHSEYGMQTIFDFVKRHAILRVHAIEEEAAYTTMHSRRIYLCFALV